MNNLKMLICTVFGAVGGFIARAFGGWSEDITTLVIFMAIDFILGLAVAMVFKKSPKTETGALESRSCFKGLCKKCAILLCVLVSARLDMTLGADYIKTATVIAFLANELISIIENVGLMGVPLPTVMTNAIDILKNKGKKEV